MLGSQLINFRASKISGGGQTPLEGCGLHGVCLHTSVYYPKTVPPPPSAKSRPCSGTRLQMSFSLYRVLYNEVGQELSLANYWNGKRMFVKLILVNVYFLVCLNLASLIP